MSAEKLPIINRVIKNKVDWFTLVALGDLHVGHKDCDEEGINNMVKWISEKKPEEYGVILTGDLIENVLPSSKGSLFEMKYPSPDDQVEITVKMLKPIAKHIFFMCDGNHEDRTQRHAGITVSKYIAKELEVPYVGYHGMLNLKLQNGGKNQSYFVYAEHGCGSIPRSIGGKYNKLVSIQNQVEADVYIKGHIHQKLVFDKMVWKVKNGRPVKSKIMFASNGSYLVDAEYALRSGFEPSGPGVAKINLATDRFNIHSSI